MQDSRMYSHVPHDMNHMALYFTPPAAAASSSEFGYEQRLIEDVRFLHSLWHQGPPPKRQRGVNIPPDFEEEDTSTESKSEPLWEKNRQSGEKQQGEESDWQTVEFGAETLNSPEKNNDGNWNPDSWETAKPSSQAEWTSATQKSEGMLFTEEEERQLAHLRMQNRATRAFKDFLTKGGKGKSSSSDSEDDTDDDDDKDSDCAPSGAHAREVCAEDFFDKLFVQDEELRRFYEQNCNFGAFECLVCAATGAKAGKKFPDCVSLIQHAMKIMKTKKKAAHRGYGRAVCTMLGWNADRLPSISKPSSLIAPRGCIPPPDEVKVQDPAEGDDTNKTESPEGDNTNKTESDLNAEASDDSDTNSVEDEEPASE
ncbi:hypothetical protein SUGI_0755970 [Cryptomeria japonica]|uniref:uncharacterized protein LOC131029657 n=1 Tax=Cryptomeria japonica TaxID=3369 RepID=UPI002414CED8|nr:uncharacterized protein LOC131029657 [Cryptomeria japonica]GLJ37265.1 hypothetical protein SUGI_0755970 [Cryptomeria japonica]